VFLYPVLPRTGKFRSGTLICTVSVIAARQKHSQSLSCPNTVRNMKYCLCDYVKQIPSWQADSSSAGEEIPRILWKLEVHYLAQKIVSQFNPFHALTFCFLKIHFNIILPSKLRSSKWNIKCKRAYIYIYIYIYIYKGIIAAYFMIRRMEAGRDSMTERQVGRICEK
jgi:hypothetical protein